MRSLLHQHHGERNGSYGFLNDLVTAAEFRLDGGMMAALGRRQRPLSSHYAGIVPMAKAGNFPWRFPGSLCGESREFRLTENTDGGMESLTLCLLPC